MYSTSQDRNSQTRNRPLYFNSSAFLEISSKVSNGMFNSNEYFDIISQKFNVKNLEEGYTPSILFNNVYYCYVVFYVFENNLCNKQVGRLLV